MSINTRKVLSFLVAVVMLVSCVAILGACNNNDSKKDKDGVGEYTYNTYLSIFPSVWNNHTYQTANDSEIIGYTEPGFFTFDYNENKDGYVVVPEMATKEPDDVTADYVGQFGIKEGDESKAWKITIHDNIKWEDGTLITANDFVESLKLLLAPEADNYRADSVYSGNLVLVGAKDYFYQGKYVYDSLITPDYISEFTKADNGQYKAGDDLVWVNLNNGSDWSSNSVTKYYNNGYLTTEDAVNAYKLIIGKADSEHEDYTAVTEEIKNALVLIAAHLHGFVVTEEREVTDAETGETSKVQVPVSTDVEAYKAEQGTYADQEWQEFCTKGYDAPEQSWDTVGVKAISDTELVIFLEMPLKGFYLLYNLTGNLNLVNTKLYKECIEYKDGVYNCTYGTSVDTYMSYGPYKLTSFQLDKEILLEKNDQWYGYSLNANKGWYQTTKIHYDYIKENETAMLAFLQGKLDAKGLDATYMDEYSKSEYIYYTDGASTFFVAMNPDLEGLTAAQEKVGANINKTIITIKEFRMGLSFSLNRAEFNLACDPTASAGFAVYNNLIISDPDNGVAYRTTEQAKKVLAEFWGVADQYGGGKPYATIDDAIASITGYNLEQGKKYFDEAYDKAVAAGLMDADDKIEICVGIPSTITFYTNGYEYLVNCWTEAVKGTKLEGKLTFTSDNTIGNGFSNALKSNQVNLLFGVGWQGSALDPYNLMEAYTSSSYQYDPSWDTKTEMLDVTLSDGKTYTTSVWDWTNAIMGQKVTVEDADGNKSEYSCGLNDNNPDDRLTILAAIEGAVLSTYDLLPLQNQSSAALKGMQIKYYTEEYVYGVGRGGIKYMTYTMDDYDWNQYVKKQGGTLNYK